jgi:hypothetical protein
MTQQVSVAVPNALLLIRDESTGEIPVSMDGATIAATPTCLAVGTLHGADGPVRITLTDEAPQNSPGLALRYIASRWWYALKSDFCGTARGFPGYRTLQPDLKALSAM